MSNSIVNRIKSYTDNLQTTFYRNTALKSVSEEGVD